MARTAMAAAAGCAGAIFAGGKCGNGALTAAMAHIFNQEAVLSGGRGAAGIRIGGAVAAAGALAAMDGPLPFGDIAALGVLTISGLLGNNAPEIYYHDTSKSGMEGILSDQAINESSRALNPKDARLGTGVYVTDIVPGTLSTGKLTRQLIGQPFPTQKYSHYVAIYTRGLPVVSGGPHHFLIPTSGPLPVAGRLVGHGQN